MHIGLVHVAAMHAELSCDAHAAKLAAVEQVCCTHILMLTQSVHVVIGRNVLSKCNMLRSTIGNRKTFGRVWWLRLSYH